MSSADSTNKGSCLCGSVTWEITAEPIESVNCHCKMCRKAHGAAFASYWFVLHDKFRWTGNTDSIIRYESSNLLTRSFCDTCGSVVPFPGTHWDAIVVPGGCHDDGRRPDRNIFVAHKAPWFDISNDLTGHEEYPPDVASVRVEETAFVDGPDGIVCGSCLCGAIEFQVTEPFRVVHNCHCSRCRRGRAAAHTTNGFTSMHGVTFTSGKDHLRSYKVPDAKYFTQVFCDVCGAKMPRIDPEREIAITPLGSLDDDPGRKPDDHIFVADKAGWYEITDNLPTYPDIPPRR